MSSTIFTPFQPQINIPLSRWERAVEILSLLLLIGMLVANIVIYPKLPAQIPSHFNFRGEVDGWSDKEVLWIFVGIVCALYAGLTLLAKMPHRLNYPVKVTTENAERQYLLGRTMLRLIKLELLLMSASIAVELTGIVRDGGVRFGVYIAPVTIAVMLVTALYFVYRASKMK